MVEGKRTENDVVRFRFEGQDIVFDKIDFRVGATQPARDRYRGRLLIDRVNRHRGPGGSRVIDDQSWDIAGARRQIENAQLASRPNPAPQKMLDQPIAAEIAVELAQV